MITTNTKYMSSNVERCDSRPRVEQTLPQNRVENTLKQQTSVIFENSNKPLYLGQIGRPSN